MPDARKAPGADGVTDPNEKLTIPDIAALYDIKPSTFRAYVNRKEKQHAPKPDGHFGRTPYWLRSTLEAWRPIPPSKENET